jgi:AraC family transcriptional regulator of adaptative response / DNA-3-methyladenine glycosylase II
MEPPAEDPDLPLVTDLATRIRRDPGALPESPDGERTTLAKALGVGATRLGVLFERHYHTTPAAFLRRARLATVCRELLASPASRHPARDLALAAGWGSPAAFDADFREATGLTPEEYRQVPAERAFTLRLPAGYRAGATLRYLGRDAESRSERVARTPSGATFAKGVWLDGLPALLTVELSEGMAPMARCQIHLGGDPRRPLSPAAAAAGHAAALRLLGLTLDPASFERQVLRRRRPPGLARLIAGREGLRLPQTAEPFEGLCWAIVGQQVNLTFAATLRRRVVELCGEPIASPEAGAILAPPTPEAVARLDPGDLTARQFSRRKAEYLIGAAAAIAAGELPLDRFPEEPATLVERRLLAVRGLGPWTAHYVMLRALGFADCVPVGDSGLAAGLVRFFALDERPGPEETQKLLAPFAPFRSFATAHLWASLGETP